MSPSSLPISARAIGELIEILPGLDVGFVVADDLVAHLLAALAVLELDRGAEHDPAVGVELCRVDDLGIGELALDFGDAPFDEALPLLGRVVIGVLGEVAVRARLGDRLDDGRPLDRSSDRCNSSLSRSAPSTVIGFCSSDFRSKNDGRRLPWSIAAAMLAYLKDRVSRARLCRLCIAVGRELAHLAHAHAAARAPASVVK